MNILFPLSEYWHLYLLFTGLVISLLLIDLGIFHRHHHAVSIKEATIWSIVWIATSLLFNGALYLYALWRFTSHPELSAFTGLPPEAVARHVGLEYLTGYIVEKSLAVDNIFIFVVIFNYFSIPAKYQHRVLFLGIIGALLFRAIFIALGSVLLQYKAVVILFGAFLIFTGFKLFFAPERKVDLEKNIILKFLRRFFPITKEFHDHRFFLRSHGKFLITPLLVALILVEFSDIIFAVDSVPAIFAITNEPFIVFTSNMFAILGLRSLYFVLAASLDRFYLLKYALGIVLIFVGLKMVWLNEAYGGEFPVSWSLGFIGFVISFAIIVSLLRPKLDEPVAYGE